MRTRSFQTLWLMLVVTGLAGTAISLLADDKSDEVTSSPTPSPIASPSPIAAQSIQPPMKNQSCLTDPQAIEDMNKRRNELDSRANEFAAKESELDKREKAINEELGKLKEIRDQIQKLQEMNKKENEGKVAKLVETFETMSPKSAAQVLSQVDEMLAIAAMSRISTQKLGKILSSMEPSRSSRLTELLAGVARAKGKDRMTVATEMTTKGGEKNDTSREQSISGDAANTESERVQ